MIVLSPHLDDAVFSCGALLAKHEAMVITICAGIPAEDVKPSHFDVMAGFPTAADAIRERRVEDLRAAAVLGIETVHSPCLEEQYDRHPDHAKRVRAAVFDALASIKDEEILLGPLGLRHPDHEAVAAAFLEFIAERRSGRAWLYEELPYRALWPEYIGPAAAGAGCESPTEYFTDTAPAIKHRALRCYTTQLVGMDTQPLLLPERYRHLRGGGKLW